MKTLATALLTAVVSGASISCGSAAGGDGDGRSPTAPEIPRSTPIIGFVGIHNFNFAPDAVHITVGGQVTWANYGPSRHTSISDDGLWASAPLFPPGTTSDPVSEGDPIAGESFTRIFPETGIYPYHCAIHPDMRGTVYVTLDPAPGGGSGKD